MTTIDRLNPIERLNIVEIDAELKFLRFSMNEEKTLLYTSKDSCKLKKIL